MSNIKVLVTGAGGQLGKTIQELYLKNTLNIDFVFFDKNDLDITNKEQIVNAFKINKFDYCINCAAYTNVEQAEKTPEIAYAINAEAVKNLAHICKANQTTLIHISTDYVFDGEKTSPYTIHDKPNPINVYGKSKLLGEQYIQEAMNTYVIIRTSWLYSKIHGHNFYKTIMKLAKHKEELRVVDDQFGSPTLTNDLAEIISQIIEAKKLEYGIYHYSNLGEVTWYNFSREILKLNNIKLLVTPISTSNYSAIAKKPVYTVLDNTVIKHKLSCTIPLWEDSLSKLS